MLADAPSSSLPCTKVVSNEQEGLAKGLRQTYLRNFDPRLSIAYRPFGNDKTVFRAGFGIFTVTALGQLQNNNESNPQASIFTYTNMNASGTPSFAFPQVAPPGVAGQAQIGGGTIEQATDPRYRDAQSAQWNVTLERELTPNTAARVSYVGMNSYRLNVTVNWNQQLPTTVPTPQPNPNPIPFPNWGNDILYRESGPSELSSGGTPGHSQDRPWVDVSGELHLGARPERCTR